MITDEQQARFGRCLQSPKGHHWHQFGTRRKPDGTRVETRKCCGCQTVEQRILTRCSHCHGDGWLPEAWERQE